MAHGQPDFGMYGQKTTVFALSDMAELAARLGSIVTFDRRGDVVWLDDFLYDMNNWTLVNSSSETATWVTTESLYSGHSVKLLANTDPTTLVGIIRKNPLPVDTRIGIEFAFLPNANVQRVRLLITLYDGATSYSVDVYITLNAQTITYYDDGGNYVVLASGVKLIQDGTCWHFFKLVLDLETKAHVRLLVDNVEYSMAGLGIKSAASASTPTLEVTVEQVANNAAAGPACYVTNIICTQNEP